MSGNTLIVIGVIATVIAAICIPYGFYLKSKESKTSTSLKMEQSVENSPGAKTHQAGRDIR